jgi:hypothetical protein
MLDGAARQGEEDPMKTKTHVRSGTRWTSSAGGGASIAG